MPRRHCGANIVTAVFVKFPFFRIEFFQWYFIQLFWHIYRWFPSLIDYSEYLNQKHLKKHFFLVFKDKTMHSVFKISRTLPIKIMSIKCIKISTNLASYYLRTNPSHLEFELKKNIFITKTALNQWLKYWNILRVEFTWNLIRIWNDVKRSVTQSVSKFQAN